MKFFALLRKEKNTKRRAYARSREDLLSRQGKEQFIKLLDRGLPISLSL